MLKGPTMNLADKIEGLNENVSQAELAKLQADAGIPDLPTQFTYQLRMAVNGKGPRAYDWQDKPHRLVYDACREIERVVALRAQEPPADVAGLVERLFDEIKHGDEEHQAWLKSALLHSPAITAQAAENARLRETLEQIMALEGEINPSNYDHDDVCFLNTQFVYGYSIARAALEGDRHE